MERPSDRTLKFQKFPMLSFLNLHFFVLRTWNVIVHGCWCMKIKIEALFAPSCSVCFREYEAQLTARAACLHLHSVIFYLIIESRVAILRLLGYFLLSLERSSTRGLSMCKNQFEVTREIWLSQALFSRNCLPSCRNNLLWYYFAGEVVPQRYIFMEQIFLWNMEC